VNPLQRSKRSLHCIQHRAFILYLVASKQLAAWRSPLCCRALAALGPSLSQLAYYLITTCDPANVLTYLTAAGMVLAPSAELADAYHMEPAAAAQLASQCAPLLLGCGGSALWLHAHMPQDSKFDFMLVLLLAVQRSFLLVLDEALPDGKAAFRRDAPPEQVTNLLQAASAALSAIPAHTDRRGEGNAAMQLK